MNGANNIITDGMTIITPPPFTPEQYAYMMQQHARTLMPATPASSPPPLPAPQITSETIIRHELLPASGTTLTIYSRKEEKLFDSLTGKITTVITETNRYADDGEVLVPRKSTPVVTSSGAVYDKYSPSVARCRDCGAWAGPLDSKQVSAGSIVIRQPVAGGMVEIEQPVNERICNPCVRRHREDCALFFRVAAFFATVFLLALVGFLKTR